MLCTADTYPRDQSFLKISNSVIRQMLRFINYIYAINDSKALKLMFNIYKTLP